MKTFRPFTNQREYLSWMEKNCYRCQRYENQSTRIEEAGCPMAFCLDLGAVGEGEIPAMYADRIGIDVDKLSDECLEIKKMQITKAEHYETF